MLCFYLFKLKPIHKHFLDLLCYLQSDYKLSDELFLPGIEHRSPSFCPSSTSKQQCFCSCPVMGRCWMGRSGAEESRADSLQLLLESEHTETRPEPCENTILCRTNISVTLLVYIINIHLNNLLIARS